MKRIIAIKKAEQEMLQVTKEELGTTIANNPWISVSRIDALSILKADDDDIVGYLAGDIDALDTDNVVDVWLIQKNFFNENYKEV